jgi:hypothetical protein
MAMPLTRPIGRTQSTYTPGKLARPAVGDGTPLHLGPSNGTSLPGGGILHTVKNPAHQVAMPTRRIVGAQ